MDQKSQQIFSYVKDDLLRGKNMNADQLQDAYVNVRLWLDTKGVSSKADGSPTADTEIKAIDANKAEVTAIALNPSYEADLSEEMDSKSASSNDEKRKARLKIGAFVALIFLGLYLLLKDGGGEPSIE